MRVRVRVRVRVLISYLSQIWACSRIACPNDCSQHGVCQDMSHYASLKDPGTGTVFAYDHIWDR